MNAPDLSEWFDDLLTRTGNRREAMEQAYIELRNSGLLSKVTLHRYMCPRNCQVAVVFRVGEATLCAVRDYKQSPGLNERLSNPTARRDKTLDGHRHWPAVVYDVEAMVGFGGMFVACRHYRGPLLAERVLEEVAAVQSGKPRRPSRV